MLQTKTETNNMVYIESKTKKIEEHILYKKICTFCCFFVMLGWMSKTCF